MNSKVLALAIGLIFVATIVGAVIFILDNKAKSISSFEECQAAGYPIMESYPEQCKTPDGRTFIRNTSQGQCYISGCSGQVCSDQKNIITTCEYKEEYACYKAATCERQADGQCGWTETIELKACLKVSFKDTTKLE